MKKILITLIILMMLIFPFSSIVAEEGLATSSSSAILLEASTGEIIFEKNPHEKLAPASMTNVMDTKLLLN